MKESKIIKCYTGQESIFKNDLGGFGLANPKYEGSPIHPDELRYKWTWDEKFTEEEKEAYLKRQLDAWNEWQEKHNPFHGIFGREGA